MGSTEGKESDQQDLRRKDKGKQHRREVNKSNGDTCIKMP